ncbi:hypothetical protein [Paracoccus marcusii]|uniref:hypothetical protein n=1 Tax=Paracoccus marcusii TaxID=59779 RepID=UPI0035A71EC8
MRVLVLVASIVQLALYGATAPASVELGPQFLRLTEEQRLYSDSPAQVAVLTSKAPTGPQATSPLPDADPWYRTPAGPVPPQAVSIIAASDADVPRPQGVARPARARGPPLA